MNPHYQNNEADINELDCCLAFQYTPLWFRENLVVESHLPHKVLHTHRSSNFTPSS